MKPSSFASARNCLTALGAIFLASACASAKPPAPPPPTLQVIETPAKLPQSARDACDVAPDDGTRGGYRKALEDALARCKGEIEARL